MSAIINSFSNCKYLLFVIYLFGFFSVCTIADSDSFDTSSVRSNFGSLLDIAAGLTDIFDFIDRKDIVTNINNQTDYLVVMGVNFQDHHSNTAAISPLGLTSLNDDDIAPAVTGTPLVYPNPFRQSIDTGAVLSYVLSKDFSLEIHIYNMLGQRVFKQTFQEGGYGARKGPNRLQINHESLGGYLLSAGVYFYVFVYNQEVLSKGKMVVKP